MIKCTILSENTVKMVDLLAEWGLSIYIEINDKKILFDCGKTYTATYNAHKLGINLRDVDLILLSHSHYDHTGGLLELLTHINKNNIKIVAHPQIWAERYNKSKNGKCKFMGMPFPLQQLNNYGAKFVLTNKTIEIAKNILTSGEIPMVTNFEKIGSDVKRVIKVDGCFVSDNILDEQSLFIKSKKGLIVITGCAHRGIINTLYHAKNITGEDKIYAVVGGIHLLHSPEEKIKQIIEEFKKLKVDKLYLGHCTGFPALSLIKQELGEKYFEINTGTSFNFAL